MSYIEIDPVTRQRIPHSKYCGDIEYDMSGDEAVVQEDVPVIGAWEDWTGSGGVPSRAQQMFAGTANTLQGTDPQITDNAKVPNLTSRGKNADTHRQRVIKKHIDLIAKG